MWPETHIFFCLSELLFFEVLLYKKNYFFFSDLDEEIISLKQFTTEDIVASAVRCLKTISNDVELPNTLPGAMSAKFRIGTGLANHIQVLI